MLGLLRKGKKTVKDKLVGIANFANLSKNSAWYPIDDHKIATVLYTGQIIVVDRRDQLVAPHLILRGLWEFKHGQFFRSIVRPGDTVFDIGANVGYYGLIASLKNTNGEVHFFEANEQLCQCIEKTMWLNGLRDRGWNNHCVVAAKSGESVKFRFFEDLWAGGRVAGESMGDFNIEAREAKTITMETMTIDDYCQKRGSFKCDVVKMDIEGYEEQALLGMTKTIAENPGIKIFAEHTFGRYSPDYWKFLNDTFRSISVVHQDGGRKRVNSEESALYASKQKDLCMLYMERTS